MASTDVLASERVLQAITDLYVEGLTSGKGARGLKAIADHPLVGMSSQVRKPRKKIR